VGRIAGLQDDDRVGDPCRDVEGLRTELVALDLDRAERTFDEAPEIEVSVYPVLFFVYKRCTG
jgi:hypothetical protein